MRGNVLFCRGRGGEAGDKTIWRVAAQCSVESENHPGADRRPTGEQPGGTRRTPENPREAPREAREQAGEPAENRRRMDEKVQRLARERPEKGLKTSEQTNNNKRGNNKHPERHVTVRNVNDWWKVLPNYHTRAAIVACSFLAHFSPVPWPFLDHRPSSWPSIARPVRRLSPVRCPSGARHCPRHCPVSAPVTAPVSAPVACRWRRERPMGALCRGSERRLRLTPPHRSGIDPAVTGPTVRAVAEART